MKKALVASMFMMPQWMNPLAFALAFANSIPWTIIPITIFIVLMWVRAAPAYYDHDDALFSIRASLVNTNIGGFGLRIVTGFDEKSAFAGVGFPFVPFYGLLHRWDPISTKFIIKLARRSNV